MNRLFRVMLVAAAAAMLAWLWYTAAPELFRAGMPSITEDADFALLVRLTGFVVILAVGIYFAVRNIPRK
jgi:uncharacterized membrane protein